MQQSVLKSLKSVAVAAAFGALSVAGSLAPAQAQEQVTVTGKIDWGLWVDPDGCMHWYSDGGLEGYMVSRRDPKTGGKRMHKGVDFAASVGTPIYSTGEGVVVQAGWQSGYGRLITVRHDFGIETRYAHLSKIRVKVGQRVSRGDRIGDMGASGRVTGVHLHYEVRVNGAPVNPMTYIKAAKNVF